MKKERCNFTLDIEAVEWLRAMRDKYALNLSGFVSKLILKEKKEGNTWEV